MSNQILDKKSEVIIAQYSNTLTDKNIKLFNYVLYCYQKNKIREITIKASIMVEEGLLSSGSIDLQNKNLWDLLGIRLIINYLNSNDKFYDFKQKLIVKTYSSAMNIFEKFDVVLLTNPETGIDIKYLKILFTPSFIEVLNSNLYYTRLDLEFLNKLNKNGVRLYEILSSLAPASPWKDKSKYSRKVTISIDKLKVLFGIDDKSVYNLNYRFISNFLKLATQNIIDVVDNDPSKLTLCSIGKSKKYFETIKNGIFITDIVFTVFLPKEKLKTSNKEYSEQEKLFFEERDALKAKADADSKLLSIAEKKKQLKTIKTN